VIAVAKLASSLRSQVVMLNDAPNLKSQLVTSSWGGARRAPAYAFTEQGVAMLSAVLRSPVAVQVSIEIVRAFVRLRQLLANSISYSTPSANLWKNPKNPRRKNLRSATSPK
jgi:hypothetical protein